MIIPESLLRAIGWEIGQELIVIDMGDGILLKPKKPFAETTLDEVAGCLKYQGTPKSLEDMDNAIRQGVDVPHVIRKRYSGSHLGEVHPKNPTPLKG